MNKSTIPKDFLNQRYLSISDGCIYYQLGCNSLRALSDKALATRKVGRRVLIDKITLDKYLEDQAQEESNS